MMNNDPVLGIDVSKDTLDCALCVDGECKSKVVTNNPQGFADLLNWLHKWHVGSPHVCMEATGVYWEACAEFLAAHDLQVRESLIKSRTISIHNVGSEERANGTA